MYWIAHYDDGTTYEQGSYYEIDRDRLAAFCVYGAGDRLVVAIDFSEDDASLGPKRLIWRRRTMLSSGDNQTIVVHLAGWQRKINGKNIQSICYVKEDTEEVVMGGQWQEGRPFMHSVSLKEFEV